MGKKLAGKICGNGSNTDYMLKKLSIYLLLTIVLANVYGQEIRFKWNARRVLMDSTWNAPEEQVVKSIIEFYKPEMDRIMQQVVGVSAREMRSGRPESLLSNFAVDAILEQTKKLSDGKVDFSLTNFGGIRSSMPGGNVRRYDIFSIFPFENYVVIVDLYGSSVRKLFQGIAQRPEALSYNVQLKIRDGELKEALIDGARIDDKRLYRVATIDFLLDGGDSMTALSEAKAVEQTGLLIRDVIFAKIEELTGKGEMIDSKLTGRISLEE